MAAKKKSTNKKRSSAATHKSTAAKAEIAVLKDQLDAVMKREKALLRVSEQKTKVMWKAAEQWEKKQVSKIQKMFKKAPKA